MTEFIYIIRPSRPEMLTSGPTIEEAAIVAEHFEYIKKMHEKKQAHFVGRTLTTGDSAMGLVVISAESEKDAHAIMKNDPAVKKKVMTGECHPFKVIFK